MVCVKCSEYRSSLWYMSGVVNTGQVWCGSSVVNTGEVCGVFQV